MIDPHPSRRTAGWFGGSGRDMLTRMWEEGGGSEWRYWGGKRRGEWMLHRKVGELGWLTREEKVEFYSTTKTCIKWSGQEEGFQGEMFTRTDHPKRPPAL